MIVPPVDEQFISDAVNTIDPPVTAADIAELWVDQHAVGNCTKAELDRAIERLVPEIEWYLTQSGEAA